MARSRQVQPRGRSVAMSARPGTENRKRRASHDDLGPGARRGRRGRSLVGLADSDFAPDGARLATVPCRTTKIWEVWETEDASRSSLPSGEDHQRRLQSGRHSAGGDPERCSVRLYDATSGEQQLVLRGHVEVSNWLVFSTDGTMLASGGRHGCVRIWALDIDDLLEIARQTSPDRSPTKSATSTCTSIAAPPEGSPPPASECNDVCYIHHEAHPDLPRGLAARDTDQARGGRRDHHVRPHTGSRRRLSRRTAGRARAAPRLPRRRPSRGRLGREAPGGEPVRGRDPVDRRRP